MSDQWTASTHEVVATGRCSDHGEGPNRLRQLGRYLDTEFASASARTAVPTVGTDAGDDADPLRNPRCGRVRGRRRNSENAHNAVAVSGADYGTSLRFPR